MVQGKKPPKIQQPSIKIKPRAPGTTLAGGSKEPEVVVEENQMHNLLQRITTNQRATIQILQDMVDRLERCQERMLQELTIIQRDLGKNRE